jgi:hypothetical protein
MVESIRTQSWKSRLILLVLLCLPLGAWGVEPTSTPLAPLAEVVSVPTGPADASKPGSAAAVPELNQVGEGDSGEVQLEAVDASQAGASEANLGAAGPRSGPLHYHLTARGLSLRGPLLGPKLGIALSPKGRAPRNDGLCNSPSLSWANLTGFQANGGEIARDASLVGATLVDGPRAMEARAYANLVRLRLLRMKLQTIRSVR